MKDRNALELLEELMKELEEEEKKATKFKDETISLKQEIRRLSLDKEQAEREAEDAQLYAKLAKDFKGTHYEPLIKDLFEIPSKKAAKHATYFFVGSVFASISITYLSSAYFDYRNSKAMEERFDYLNNNITRLQSESELLAMKTGEINDQIHKSNRIILSSESKKNKIKEQVKWYTNYVRTNRLINENLDSYTRDANDLAVLYFLMMPNQKKAEMLYESYLESFRILAVNSDILPINIYKLFEMDIWRLRGLFSAYLITKNKYNNNWVYRSVDASNRTFTETNPIFDFKEWGYQAKTYQKLYIAYREDLRALMSQLRINDKLAVLSIPRKIYYASYNDYEKDKMVYDMLHYDGQMKSASVLEIDISNYPLDFTSDVIEKVQMKLEDKGFLSDFDVDGKYGAITINAIRKYEHSIGIKKTGSISLNLLDNLEITVTCDDLVIL